MAHSKACACEASSSSAEQVIPRQEHVSILENISDGLAALDRQWRYTYVNSVAERLLGKSRDQLLGRVMWEVFPESAGSPFHQACMKAESEGLAVRHEGESALLGGFLEDTIYPSSDGMTILFRDVTEQKRREQALRESQRLLNRSQEIAHLGSWELDLVKNELTWSDEVYRIFGLEPQEFGATYEAFLDAVHPEDRPAVDAAYSGSVREGRSSYEIQHRVVRRSTGEIRWVHEKCEHIRNASGNIIRSVGMVLDITERKHAEQAVKQAQAEAERHAGEMEAVISSLSDGLTLFDVHGTPTYVNSIGKEILGVSSTEELASWDGRSITSTLDGRRLPLEEWPSRRALRGETSRGRYSMMTAAGRHLLISITASPVRDSAGNITGAVTVFNDASSEVDSERAQQKALEREKHIAATLQQALVPPSVPEVINGYRFAAAYKPALNEAEIGGDFYDVFDLGDGRVCAMIGDVAGKGLRAAIRVAAARYAIRSYAFIETRPSRILSLANDSLCCGADVERDMLTAFLMIVDTRLGVAVYANAGHEPPVVLTGDGSVQELASTGAPLGIFPSIGYSEGAFRLDPGSRIVMLTDGMTEARKSTLELYGIERVTHYVRGHREASLQDIAGGLLDAAVAYAGGKLQDDAAVVLVEQAYEQVKE